MLMFSLVALASLAFAQTPVKTDCEVLHDGFPLIPATGCCGFDDEMNLIHNWTNGWLDEVNLGVFCGQHSEPETATPFDKVKWIEIPEGSGIEGSIPADINLLNHLSWFDLYGNNIGGEIPVELCELTRLRQFSIGFNSAVKGKLPACINKLVNMLTIDVSDTSMTGTIPDNLASMSLLRVLRMSNFGTAPYTGILPNLGALAELEVLYLTTGETYAEGKVPMFGIFPDLTKTPNFKECNVIPSNLCRRAEVEDSVYVFATNEVTNELECDAIQLPLCTPEFVTLVEAVYAMDPTTDQAAYDAAIKTAWLGSIAGLADNNGVNVTTVEAVTTTMTPIATATPTAVIVDDLNQTSAASLAFAAPGIFAALLLALAVL